MIKNVITLISLVILASCDGRHVHKGIYNKPVNDSAIKRKAITPRSAANHVNADDDEPSFKEVLADLLASYNKTKIIDKSVIDGSDSLHIHLKYYCLHDSSLIIPRHYLWGGDTTKDFVTNNFAEKVIVVKNRDTVLNKVFTKVDFNRVIKDPLTKYAVIFDPEYSGYDKAKGEFALAFSISIPLTDVGVPAYLIIDKKGNYKFLDQYTKIENFEKN